jgi:hypothetical protein
LIIFIMLNTNDSLLLVIVQLLVSMLRKLIGCQ